VNKSKGIHRVRCRKKGLPYDSSVNVRHLIKRDKQKCFWCGRKTLASFKWLFDLFGQTPHERSPTIDHVVPLNHPRNTKHGHTDDNTVLCCFKCNTDKLDKLVFEGIEKASNPVEFARAHLAS
jgi:5-methylcytosine-specific restriction endonuclease McrA